MAQEAATNSGYVRGRVKAVPSGDSLVIMLSTKADGIPPEKTIILAHLLSPKLARDEPFAWESREFLRKLCVGKDVFLRTEYTIPNFSREFCSLYIGTTNISEVVVANGWAKVIKPAKGREVTPGHELPDSVHALLVLEGQAMRKGLGLWNKSGPPPFSKPSNMDAMGLVDSHQGRPIEAIVEQVRDGSSLRVYLLPDFHFVQVFVAGIKAPSMGRRSPVEVSPDPYGPEAKHFTEIRVLHRDVRIFLEGVDKFNNLIGSVYYPAGESFKDLALELIENGLAKYVESGASVLEDDARSMLKAAEVEAKNKKLRLWENYVLAAPKPKVIYSDKFSGKVVEVVSGDCIVVADNSAPFGSPSAERQVHLSSIRCPTLGNPKSDEQPAPYAREAKEFLRKLLIGREVQVSMEYTQKIPTTEVNTNTRVMRFGSVFVNAVFVNAKDGKVHSQVPGVNANVAELVIARGLGTVIKDGDLKERSSYYENLLAAESRATSRRKGIHSSKDSPPMNVTDLFQESGNKVNDFLPVLQQNRRMPAVVEYVASGHRFKLFVPKENCSIAFSFSGVRCPVRQEPYSVEAVSLMRRRIMQRDVEIEVETVDRTGTFLGSLWDSKSNVVITLLESGLARLQTTFGTNKLRDGHLLTQAQQLAKKQKLKIWENYVEGQEVQNQYKKKKEEFNAIVTEVLGGGKFYVQAVSDPKLVAIQNKLASLTLTEAPVVGTFNPQKGDLVLAQFSGDDSWNRAMVVNTPSGGVVESLKDKFEVFYIDYGNQEVVAYNRLRPLDQSVSSEPGIAQLCSLAYLKVPNLTEDYGREAAIVLSKATLNKPKAFIVVVEDKVMSGGKGKGQGTGNVLMVNLIGKSGENVSGMMLEEGVARLERRRKREPKWKQEVLDELEEYQEEAREQRVGMWRYGDVDSGDDENPLPSAKKVGGGKR